MATLSSGSILQQQTRNRRDALTVDDFNKIWSDLVAINAEASGGTGNVFGPASSVDQNIALFDGTTGKIILDSGYTIAQLIALIFDGAIVVDASTTANLAAFTYDNGVAGVGATITMNAVGAFPNQDGVAMNTVGKKLLVKNAATAAHRGVYVMTTAGTGAVAAVWTRATNSDEVSELYPQVVIVGAGTTLKNKLYAQTNAALAVIGTDAITYSTPAAPNMTGYMSKAVYDPAALSAQVMVTPVSKTVAQLTALIGSFVPGQIYKITDQTYFPDGLYVTAYDVDELLPYGYGAFINGAMSDYVMAQVAYSLVTNAVTSVYVAHLQDGTPTNVWVSDYGNGAIGAWPFDSVLITDFYAENPIIGGSLGGTIQSVRLGSGCTIMCGVGCTIGLVTAGSGSSVQAVDVAGAGVIGGCTIGHNSTVLIVSWTMQNFTVGDGKNIDTTSLTAGGTITNGYYIGDVSTIVITNADVAANELSMASNLGIIDMTNFAFAGKLMVISDVGVTPLKTMTAMPTDHNVKIFNSGDDNGLIIQDSDLSGGNILLEASNTAITINKDLSGLEFLELKNNGTVICQQSATIRI